MARAKRVIEIGYYHVLNRGVEKRCIYLDAADYRNFLALLGEYQSSYHYFIHAHCLMPNHYHLLIETKEKNLSQILQKINHKYANYFNYKYGRVGHLWQGRFKSWHVTNERYLNTLIKYIEQNPIKAGITNEVGDYQWSSSITKDKFISDNEMLELQDLIGVRHR